MAEEERAVPPEAEQFRAPETGQQVDPLLLQTVYNEEEKARRTEVFDQIWQERWRPAGVKEGYFQTAEDESPFAQYSSKGWKVHIAFNKGGEQEVARSLYTNGLYFKVEAGHGTYFNGLKESGATVYIGSHDNMQRIAELIDQNLGGLLSRGVVDKAGNRAMRMGSGSDIEVRPGITARFDVAKTKFGWVTGNRKYSEYGMPTWTRMGGFPYLRAYEQEAERIIDEWKKNPSDPRAEYYRKRLGQIYEASRRELAKDFGEEFVFGKN